MSVEYTIWSGDDWELHVHGLLKDRHGSTNVMKVPGRHSGDWGLDYYCLSDGVVYQCYAALEPLEVSLRADKQKVKITKDLKKFSTNQKDLSKLFSGIKIRRWILVVPIHDSKLVNLHAVKKAAEISKLNLPYVADGFEVLIHDLSDFDAESVAIRALTKKAIVLPKSVLSDEEIEKWTFSSNDLVQNLQRKLQKRISAGAEISKEELSSQLISEFLYRENTLDNLRKNSPDLFEKIDEVISSHSRALALSGHSPDGTAHSILSSALKNLTNDIRANIPNFSSQDAEKLAYGSIADWLLRCPLDFPPYTDAL